MTNEGTAEPTADEQNNQPAEGTKEPENLTPEARVERAEREASDFRDKWMRAAADYQNLKRRSEQERQDLARFANAALIINILPILDDMERALSTLDAKLAGLTWVEGIYHIYRKFKQALESAGVSEIETDGADFDPNLHEAVQYSEGYEGKVISVVQKGYKLGDRVIRPSMVVVGKGDQSDQPTEFPPSEEQGEQPTDQVED
ncbi:MAG TPA: nucleotide exchange factor GrpE [Dehalococcoidia bacterium]|nr:nucleotide exchange factor GrpE [Dehalococcoidia bacterium]